MAKKLTITLTQIQYDAIEDQAAETDQTVQSIIQTNVSNYADGAVNALMSEVKEEDIKALVASKLEEKKAARTTKEETAAE